MDPVRALFHDLCHFLCAFSGARTVLLIEWLIFQPSFSTLYMLKRPCADAPRQATGDRDIVYKVVFCFLASVTAQFSGSSSLLSVAVVWFHRCSAESNFSRCRFP